MSVDNDGRIQIHGRGIGELSDLDVEQRAMEIARMDGRLAAGIQDRFRAREELLHPGPPNAAELSNGNEAVQKWGKGPASHGKHQEKIGFEDEENIAEKLVNEGVEEADQDRRLSAAEFSAEEIENT